MNLNVNKNINRIQIKRDNWMEKIPCGKHQQQITDDWYKEMMLLVEGLFDKQENICDQN